MKIKKVDNGSVQILEEKSFEEFSIALRNDGLVAVRVISNYEIDVHHVEQVVKALKEIGNGAKYPLLIVVGEYTLPSPDARAYIATAESDPYASAEAYVIQSFSQKIVGNGYLRFNKPARPTHIFTDEEKAIEWLKTFL